MIHLFKHKDGKYDIALVVKGKFIVGSNQHYSRKKDAINAIIKVMDCIFFNCDEKTYTLYQDDTLVKPLVFMLYDDGVVVSEEEVKPKKPYIPNKKYTPKTKK